MPSDSDTTEALHTCLSCGEVMPGHHDCNKAREARALWEAAKRANDPDSRNKLSLLAYQAAEDAESHG